MHHPVESSHNFSDEFSGPFGVEVEAVNLRQRQTICRFHEAFLDLSFTGSNKSSAHRLSLDGQQTSTVVAANPKERTFIAARKERPRCPETKAMVITRALGHMFRSSIHQVKSSLLSIPIPGIQHTTNALLGKRHKPDFLEPVNSQDEA